MPWKEERDPYLIWLSEIILQQTRVEQGMAYFERFKSSFPTVQKLAKAEDQLVMKLWEGLGYYSRARNLLKAARLVSNEYAGVFPNTYTDLLKLPGVGPYTAAAIASFAYDLPVPVVDGNVYRVLSRFANDSTPIDTTTGRKHYTNQAEKAFAPQQAARYNQAIMDFGALVCTPKKASCQQCPLRENCQALAKETIYKRPVKEKKLKRITRYFHYLVIRDQDHRLLLQQRLAKDIWQDLFQFPLLEREQQGENLSQLIHTPVWPRLISPGDLAFSRTSKPFKQQLTHQTIIVQFHEFKMHTNQNGPDPYFWVEADKVADYAFPKVITSFLAEKSLYLDLF